MVNSGRKSKEESAKIRSEILRRLRNGQTRADIQKIVGISSSSWNWYMENDDSFRLEVEKIKSGRNIGTIRKEVKPVPDFPEFCETYLNTKLYTPHLQWVDVLEGRAPRNLHPSQTYQPGDPQYLVVNTPPGHAKSTTITVNYVVWRIVQDPNIAVAIISNGEDLTKKFLLQIRERLTDPHYQKLQDDFAPDGGWKEGSASWKANAFYVNGRDADKGADPTVSGFGWTSAIYGRRWDLVIIDDAVDNFNAKDYNKQFEWIQSMVNSRLNPETGRCIVIGTRIAADDLYSTLRDHKPANDDTDDDEDKDLPWTYLSQPAVLEFNDDVNKWVTLWPWSNIPTSTRSAKNELGEYSRFSGKTLKKIRSRMNPVLWGRIYQQEQISTDNYFNSEKVHAAVGARSPGLIPDDPKLGRAGGMSGLHVIAGLDPATVGHTGAVVYAINRQTGDRYVVDVSNVEATKPEDMRFLIKQWTVKYSIKEWRIERNAFQRFLTQDQDIINYLANHGCILTEHTTGANKADPDFGVLAMSGLFEAKRIHLPKPSTEAAKDLINQLLIWEPGNKKIKTDIVMALWFCELRAIELITRVQAGSAFRDTMFTTRGDKKKRYIFSNQEYNALESIG